MKATNSISNYYPFGMMLPGRSFSDDSYRYGFQGQEKDDEIKVGEGTSINYKYRMHDPRVGRFFAVDPLSWKYPHNSPYAFSENRLLDGVELEGLEWEPVYDGNDNLTAINLTISIVDSDPMFEVYNKDELMAELSRQFTELIQENFGCDVKANLTNVDREDGSWNTPYIGSHYQVSGNVGGSNTGFASIDLPINKDNPEDLKDFANNMLHEVAHAVLPGHPSDSYYGGDDKLQRVGNNTFKTVEGVTDPQIMDNLMLYPYFTIDGTLVGDYRSNENYDVPLSLTVSQMKEMFRQIEMQKILGVEKYEQERYRQDVKNPGQEDLTK